MPASGWYTCLLSVTNRNKSSLDDPGPCTTDPDYCYRIYGAGSTWLSALDVDAWAVQSTPNARVLLEPGQAYDVAVLNFTAPTGVTSFRATSDIELTNCYNDYQGKCDGPYDPDGASIVSTKLQVMQKAVGGGYCQITNYPSSGYQVTTVGWSEHHKPAYHTVVANVSTAANCTRDFRIKVYVQSVLGNDAILEKNPYTSTWVR